MSTMIDLAAAYATQTTTDENGKSEWVVYNEKKEEIHRFPDHFTEKQVMSYIHFGRKFELIAFNTGIDFQKSLVPGTITQLQEIVKNLRIGHEQMREENEKLANELDTLTLKYN